MTSFKPKNTKKLRVFKKYMTTLDSKHDECTKEFMFIDSNVIPKLEDEKTSIKTRLETERMTLEQQLDLKDRIKEINKTIRQLKQKQTDYLLDNSKYIFEYFENKKDINNVCLDKEKQCPNPTTKTQLVNNIFKISTDISSTGANNAQIHHNIHNIHNNETNVTDENKQLQDSAENKQDIIKKYFSNVDNEFLDMNLYVRDTDICQRCFKGEMVPLDDEGVLICNNCAVNMPYLIENEKPSYKEPPKEVCFYAYKKINHFKEIIAQFQGKETTLRS